MRARIGASNLLTAIEKVEGEVSAIAKGPVIAEDCDEEAKQEAIKLWLATSPVKLSASKILLDSQYKRLAKVVPDLKAIEISQDPENPVFSDERSLDAYLERAAGLIEAAERGIAATASGKGPIH